MRVYQWVKNTLVFVPVIGAHQVLDLNAVTGSCIAFAALSLCASAGYVFNDLLDLKYDRNHPDKRHRPLASGIVAPTTAMVLVPSLLLGGLAIGAILGPQVLAILGAYCLTTCVYTLWLKRVVLLDVFILASLYALRVYAGELATGIAVSDWLLLLSMFLFVSLALVKRYSELCLDSITGLGLRKARGYASKDQGMLLALGVGSGCLSALVLALYVQSGAVSELYSRPRMLWLSCPLMFFWISRVWLLAGRGEVHHDPILFAFRDRVSYVIGAAVGILVFAAR
jgi:4-hydroxybenzoate polyprenyltransferase